MNTQHITIEADSADLFYLAKLIRRQVDKAKRDYAKPKNIERRAELAAQGKGDVAWYLIEKHERLWAQLYSEAKRLRDCQG